MTGHNTPSESDGYPSRIYAVLYEKRAQLYLACLLKDYVRSFQKIRSCSAKIFAYFCTVTACILAEKKPGFQDGRKTISGG